MVFHFNIGAMRDEHLYDNVMMMSVFIQGIYKMQRSPSVTVIKVRIRARIQKTTNTGDHPLCFCCLVISMSIDI